MTPPKRSPKSGPKRASAPSRPGERTAGAPAPSRAPRPKSSRPGPSRPRPKGPEKLPASLGPGENREISHVVSLDKLAGSAVEIALAVEHAVLHEERRADRAIAWALRNRRDLALPDHRFISRAVFALFRWRGWIETIHLEQPEARLLLAWLMDSTTVHPACRVWSKAVGRNSDRMQPVGDAPNWTARGEGWKRLNEGRVVSADPWRLFPDWIREHLPLPPGGGSPKTKYLELLQTLQTRAPLWVRAQGADEQAIWKSLGEQGIKPWVHRKITRAAKLDPESDIYHLPAFEKGEIEIQDLASQAVALVCDPDPGERWWDACAGGGGKSLHLAALMGGKGLVVATDVHEAKLKETVRRARKSPFRNITTRPWDGKHVVGKSGKYDGVLVDAPCTAMGTWRRNPDARWTLDPGAVARLAETHAQAHRASGRGGRWSTRSAR